MKHANLFKLIRRGLILACIAAGLQAPAILAQTGDGTIRGTVTGSETDFYLDGATVQVLGTNFRAATDRFGRFSINLVPRGTYEVVVRYVGYDSVTREVVVGDDPVDLAITLSVADDVIELEEYVVTADVSASARALSRQNAANNRVDIVASDKFGLLPDNTVADALRRLPGINVEKDAQGRAGRYVTIRGMNADFNSVTVNGQKVMVSNFDGASRSVPLDVVPSKNAESIEVTKSVLPSQSADAIGGAINIRSSSAFDRQSRDVSLEASIGDLSLADKYTGGYPHDETPYEFSASWSDVINSDRTIGLSLSLNQSSRPFLFRSIENGPYILDLGDYFPSYGRLEEAFDNVDTTGVAGRFDYRPSERFQMSFDFNYSLRETNQGSQRADVNFDPFYLVGDLETKNNTAVAFTSEDRSQREVRDYYEEQENLTLTVQFKHDLGDLEIDYGLGANLGDFAGDKDKDLRAFFRTDFQDPEGNYYQNSYALQDGDPYNPVYGDNVSSLPLSEFEIFEVRRGTREIEDRTTTGFLNLKKDMVWGTLPGYLKGGITYTMNDRDFDDIRRRYRTADVDWTLESVIINGDEEVFGSVVADYGVKRALNGQDFGVMIDPDKMRAAEEALIAAGIRDRDDPNWYLNQNVSRDARADLINSYELEENVFGTYLEAEMNTERVTLIGGFRVEATDVEVDTYAGDFFESDPDSPLFPQPIKGKNDYVDVFPHLHVRYNLSDDTTLRASINQTLARPSYRQLNPSTDIDPTVNDDDGLVIKGRTDLDPVISTNLDLSVDHSFGRAARASLSVFYKNMENNIYRLSRGVIASDPGYFPPDAEVREFLNADGAEVFGVEIALSYSLDAISEIFYGFDLSANYTYTDSEVDGIQRVDENGDLFSESGRTQLFGQVPHTVNVALNFARWGFESRLAWNWTDAYLDFNGIDADQNLDNYLDTRSRVDFSLRYRFQENWTVFLEIQNLFDDDTRAYEGDDRTRMFYREDPGRLSVIGIRWNL
jgi:TonB-dependent receptor